MGTFINKGNAGFRQAVNGDYVDKTELIAYINKTLCTERSLSCVTRCRRFGKTMAADMLYAYYDKSCDSRSLFAPFKIARDPSFEEHLNKYPVIKLDVTTFTSNPSVKGKLVSAMQTAIGEEILLAYPDVRVADSADLMDVLFAVHCATGEKFILVIDEWDAICRECGDVISEDYPDMTVMDEYVMLLCRLFKTQNSKDVFAGVYMTGILPIKKYNTQSALNNFEEYSMVDPGDLAPFFGFTREEVEFLAAKHDADKDGLKQWYDGYKIGKVKSIYNPYSVSRAIQRHKCKSYWSNTGAYDSVKTYIQMNFDGLKDSVIKMLSGESVRVNTTKFLNDIHAISSRDDVLTVLIHLGYLAFDEDTSRCFIPNKEVADELTNAVESTNWTRLAKAISDSYDLLDATLNCNEMAVAQGIEQVHDENVSILSYNDENSLACVLSMAYISAQDDYIIHREYATGKGYADLVFIPRKSVDVPAILMELKCGYSAEKAIAQIKNQSYYSKLAEYSGNIILVGINYDKKTKSHTCRIEKIMV